MHSKGEVYLKEWSRDRANRIKLVYSDNEIVYVTYEDFNRAFGTIFNATKEEVIRDFAIKI